jgi:hypothetical protein
MHTPASLKAEHKTLAAAKAFHGFKAKSWQALADKLKPVIDIAALQLQIKKLEAENAALKQQLTATQSINSEYFISPEAEIVYSITQLDGEQRLKALGINRTHYKDVKKAKDWRNNLAMKIHPDHCVHPHAAKAMDEITILYENMVAV